jgi:glycosyltransferase involved in cell wall biosynthesis
LKILIALTYYRPHFSGLTIYAEREACALAARGHHVTVLTSRFSNHLPARELRDGVQIIRPRVMMHISKGVVMPTMALWGARLARQSDVVHLHLPQLDAAPIALACRLMGIPLAATYHCDMLLPSGLVNSLANQASNLANHIAGRLATVLAHNTRDYAESSPFLKHYLDKVHPIFPPIEITPVSEADLAALRERAAIQPGQRIIGMAARLATEKGAEYLAEALPRVLQKYPTARVLHAGEYQNVFGEQQYAQRLVPMIEQLGGHWMFLGSLTPAQQTAFYRLCEVTVLPSINSTESFGMVQVESMACGTPVIASDRPGMRVPVQMTGMGRLFPPADAAALAEALIDVLDSPEHYHNRPDDLVQRSTPAHVAAEYEKVFELAMGRA